MKKSHIEDLDKIIDKEIKRIEKMKSGNFYKCYDILLGIKSDIRKYLKEKDDDGLY